MDRGQWSGYAVGRSRASIAFIYIAFGFAWILLSNEFVTATGAIGPLSANQVEVTKGLIFVLVSGALIAVLQVLDRRYSRHLENQLSEVIESSNDAIACIDLSGRITSWNAAATKIFGYRADEVVGGPVSLLSPPGREHEIDELLLRVTAGHGLGHFQTQRLAKGQRTCEISLSISPIKDAHRQVVGASLIARDITQQKNHENELVRLSRLYAALGHVNQAIARADSRDGLFAKVCEVLVVHGGFRMAWIGWREPNAPSLAPMAKYGDAHGFVEKIERFLVFDDPGSNGPAMMALRTGSAQINNDVLANSQKKTWYDEFARSGFRASAAFPVHMGGRTQGVLCVYSDQIGFFRDREVELLVDATADTSFGLEKLAAEAATRAAEDRAWNEQRFSNAMIESMPGIVYFYDQAGQFLRWNMNFETVSGYSATEIANMHPLQFFQGADRTAVAERIRLVFERGESSVEALFTTKSGQTYPYFFSGRRVSFGGRTCLVGVGIDISERKAAERVLENLNRTLEEKVRSRTVDLEAAMVQAQAADKLKSAFLATMSHELRTPLNSILGFTGILLQGLAGSLNAEQSKQLGMVRGSARHLLDLINDVLDISKIEAGQLVIRPQTFDLAHAIEGVIASVKPAAEKKHLKLELQAQDVGMIVGDERRVVQVLLNVVNNAIKFTNHGLVSVEASRMSGDLDVPSSSETVVIRVKDTGCGIEAEHLHLLFQPFRQIDTGLTRQHEGTGLGLAICWRLVKLMGGSISVASVWSRGTEVTIKLPAHGQPHYAA